MLRLKYKAPSIYSHVYNITNCHCVERKKKCIKTPPSVFIQLDNINILFPTSKCVNVRRRIQTQNIKRLLHNIMKNQINPPFFIF